MDIDDLMNQFRIASRELFNHYFRFDDPYSIEKESWALQERFSELQRVLFDKMVVDPAGIGSGIYGHPLEQIIASGRLDGTLPAMINREKVSGYWDYPVREIPGSTKLVFVAFFDWDQLAVRDNRYVRAQIVTWPGREEAVGKHVLVESNLVKFTLARS